MAGTSLRNIMSDNWGERTSSRQVRDPCEVWVDVWKTLLNRLLCTGTGDTWESQNQWAQFKAGERDYLIVGTERLQLPTLQRWDGWLSKKLLPIRWRLLCVSIIPSCLLKRPTHLANLATHLSAKLDKDKNLVGSRTVQIFSLHFFSDVIDCSPLVSTFLILFFFITGCETATFWSAPFSNICNFWARNLNW